MKYFATLLFASALSSAFAQGVTVKVERHLSAPMAREINFSDTTLQDWQPAVNIVLEGTKQDLDYIPEKEVVNEMRRQHKTVSRPANASRSATPPAPVMLTNFSGSFAQSTPNDNHIAVSDSGKVVSVVNTNIRVYTDTGGLLLNRALVTFANSLGVLQLISDPRIIYDPINDRFICIFFSGYTSNLSTVIVAFSKTANPAGAWNFYKLSGNLLNDTTWTDYPIVSISDHDLYMTYNHLSDGEDWKTGFRYSVIWQVDMAKGYAGDSLQYNYFHDIKYKGKPIWNVCPVRNGSLPSGPETYFISVGPHDLQNDTVFLHTISNSFQSGNAQFSSKVLTTNVPYGLPPNAKQKDGQYLATNDARVLDAFYENGKIQYVQNTVDTSTMTSGVYVGEIDLPASNNPTVRGQIISSDTIDYGYPSLAYIGNNAFDNRAIITCSFSAKDTFPGTVAFYKDGSGNISEKLVVKYGQSGVNQIFNDTVERWGDYSGIQRKYNEPNTAWLAGSYVNPANAYYTWVAKVVNTDSNQISAIDKIIEPKAPVVYPNPAKEKFSLQIEVPDDNYMRFDIFDVNGKLIRTLLEDKLEEGTAVFSFNTQYLSTGLYFLKISNHGNLLRSEKVVISR